MQTRTVAKTILVNGEGKLLLLRRSSSDTRRPLQWDLPGGHTDGDEYPAEAAARETAEEAGISLTPRELRLVYAMTEKVEDDLSVTWLFHIAHTDSAKAVISQEHEEYDWQTLPDALQSLEYERQKRVLAYLYDTGLFT